MIFIRFAEVLFHYSNNIKAGMYHLSVTIHPCFPCVSVLLLLPALNHRSFFGIVS